jgi:hypothetical protein
MLIIKKINIIIILYLILTILCGCSRKPSSTDSIRDAIQNNFYVSLYSHASTLDYKSLQTYDTLTVEIIKGIKNCYSGALSPDEKYIALISKQHPIIINISNSSTVFVSNSNFPMDYCVYQKTQWSENGNRAIFSYNDSSTRKGATVVWDKKTGREFNYPALIDPAIDSSGVYLIGWNVANRTIQIIDIDSQDTAFIPNDYPGSIYYNFNWISNDTILYTADIYNSFAKKFDHSEILLMNFRTQKSDSLCSSPDQLDYFKVCPDKQKAILFKFPDRNQALSTLLATYPGKSGFFNLKTSMIEHFDLKLGFHSVSKNSKQILCTVAIISTGMFYGIYCIDSGKTILLKTTSGKYILSQMEGSYSQNYLLLQTVPDMLVLVRLITPESKKTYKRVDSR